MNLPDAVAAEIADRVERGIYRPGQMLPPSRELAEELNVSSYTVQQACKMLGEKGVLELKPRSAPIVSHKPMLARFPNLELPRVVWVVGVEFETVVEFCMLAAKKSGWPILDVHALRRNFVRNIERIDLEKSYASEVFWEAAERAALEAAYDFAWRNSEANISSIICAPSGHMRQTENWLEQAKTRISSLEVEFEIVLAGLSRTAKFTDDGRGVHDVISVLGEYYEVPNDENPSGHSSRTLDYPHFVPTPVPGGLTWAFYRMPEIVDEFLAGLQEGSSEGQPESN